MVGDPAPGFELLDHLERPVRLADFADRWVLLWWYPKACTGG